MCRSVASEFEGRFRPRSIDLMLEDPLEDRRSDAAEHPTNTPSRIGSNVMAANDRPGLVR